jgi:hypothetical protein
LACAPPRARAAELERLLAPGRAAGPERSADELFNQYRPAVVKITIKQRDIPIGWGAGFFVGRDGRLITNYHVIRPAIKNPAFTAEFELGDGRIAKSWTVASCGDARGIDLCLLKLPLRPKSWFSPSAYRPRPGEAAFVIGHPQGFDFSIANGIVSALREGAGKPAELQITAAISPGNSGGPIFNSRGQLLGVASKYLKDGQNLNFGIASGEIRSYIDRGSRFFAPDESRRRMAAEAALRARQLYVSEIAGAYSRLARGAAPSDAPGFRAQELDFGDDSLIIPLPRVFDACRRSRDVGAMGAGGSARNEEPVFACAALNNSAILTAQRLRADPGQSLLALNATRALAEKPLPIVDALAKAGLWAQYAPTLSVDERRSFYSQPSRSDCQKLARGRLDGAYFANSPACVFSVANDADFGAYSAAIWLQKDGFVYGFQAWMEDARMAEYFRHVPALAALAAKLGRSRAASLPRASAAMPEPAAAAPQAGAASAAGPAAASHRALGNPS